ncbi:hypothetical protein CALCODRAFT_492311 [Calocera cornea HHB12733]|uniref:Uncharacterized protein n=1 Tax=Calocera cornea HHB12733 TaxID=1353952 RepID=A0A165IG66_9BASI|nr:hypothetical protein CALCODRAFT_492311 [Calocera cornea HHB12733]
MSRVRLDGGFTLWTLSPLPSVPEHLPHPKCPRQIIRKPTLTGPLSNFTCATYEAQPSVAARLSRLQNNHCAADGRERAALAL